MLAVLGHHHDDSRFLPARFGAFVTLENFGFRNIIWFFSGRRGLHCWVCDRQSARLDTASRKALVQFLQFYCHSEGEGSPLLHKLKHPAIAYLSFFICRKFLEISHSGFVETLASQGYLSDNARFAKLLSLLNDDCMFCLRFVDLLAKVPSELSSFEEGAPRWRAFSALANQLALKVCPIATSKTGSELLANATKVLQACFVSPRLDSNVTIQLNHLIKSPFCVHPDTGTSAPL